MQLKQVRFVRSAASPEDFPRDRKKHIVLAGRSNVGKSSTLNCLTGQKNFARVSSSPGKTIFINLFLLESDDWLVDLPGYGYSKTSHAERTRYSGLIEAYLANASDRIARVYLIVDIRHKPTDEDQIMVNWLRQREVPFTVIANKLDKLKPSQVESALECIRETLLLTEDTLLIPFSAEKHNGADQIIRDILDAISKK